MKQKVTKRRMVLVLILNDQGGGVMNVSNDIVNTLLSHNLSNSHQPIVLIEEMNDDLEPLGCTEQAHTHS